MRGSLEERRKDLYAGDGQDWEGLARMAGARLASGVPLDELDEEALEHYPAEARIARMLLRIRRGEVEADY